MNPSARTLNELRKTGWLADTVERYIAAIRQRKDWRGMFDIIAIRGDVVLGVQVTTASNVSARVRKLQSNPDLAVWLSSATRCAEVHGWAKRGPRGKRKVWACQVANMRQFLGVPQLDTGAALTGTISPHP